MPPSHDLCVVGTGPSAYFLVRKYLSKNPFAKVIVLEAGFNTIDFSTPLSDRDSTATEFKLSPTVNIGLGGTSQLWHNVLAPLDNQDFRLHSWIPHSGWQISRDTLDPYYAEVSDFFDFPKDIFDDPSAYCDFETERKRILFDEDVFDYKVFVHPSKYLRTNVAFTELLKAHKGLKLKQGVVALKFENVGEKNRLVIYDRTRRQKSTIDAKNYVLCCGALNNPEILLNSDHIRKKIPCIGQYLMDHPMGNFYQYKYDTPVSAKIYSGVKFQKGTSIKIALKLKFKIQREKQLANSAFYLRPSFSEGFNNHTEVLKNQLLTVRSKLKQLKFPVKEALGLLKDLNMVTQIIQYKTGLLSKHSLTECMFVTEQIPSSFSRLELMNEKNEYGNYKTKILWDVSNKDIEEVVKLKEFIDSSLMSLNSATATYDSEQYDWRDRLTSAAHHLGTVRMSKDVSSGCVDLNLKLHGFNDIYVCDGSVFPTSGNANPTMTCMALAARLGEEL